MVTANVELFVPPEARRRILGFTETVGPGGFTIRVKLIAPEKPLTLETDTADWLLPPATMFRTDGFATIVKSGVGGGGGLTTVNLTMTLCDRLPLVPVTLTAKVSVGVPSVVTKVSVAVPVPPGLSVTLFGLTPHEGQLGQSGGGDVKRLTVPANPLMLASTIVEVAVVPCCTFSELGFAVMEKFGGTGLPNDAV